MMTALNRKLLRNLMSMKGQAVAICLVIACGVATFVMSLSTLQSLQLSRTTYYERYRFAQVFSHLKRAPDSLAGRIAEIPGVAAVQTRIVVDVTLDVAGLDEPAVGRLISMPEWRTRDLNDIHIRNGRYLEPGREGEVLVSEAFAQAHDLVPGDTVLAVINGRKDKLNIVGVAMSPEYVIQVRGGDLLPDDKRFGVFWIGTSELAAAFDMEGAFNDISLTLMPGASQPAVIDRLDRLTALYGGLGAYGRKDHLSHSFLDSEIKGLRAMALIIPTIFLAVSAFLLNVVLSRLIATQREEIAALKAFGYTHWEVGWHYLKLVMIIGVLGAVLGTVTGVWLGRGMTAMYARFYRFPMFEFDFELGVVLLGCFVSVAAASLGVLTAVRRAVQLPPAEAMRPEPPAKYRPTIVERWGLQRFLAQSARMILRHLERHPLKAALSCSGIAMSAAIIVVGSFSEDALDYMMERQFKVVQREGMTVFFVEPESRQAIHEIERLPGVIYAEPFRALAVRVRSAHRSRRVGILGFKRGSYLRRLMDLNDRPVVLPPEGLVLSDKLADLLGVGIGDTLRVEVLEGERPIVDVVVTGMIGEYAGINAYMEIGAMNRLAHEGNNISGALLAVDSRDEQQLYRTLKNTPQVASVTVKQAALDSFKETVAENLLQFRVFNIIFASIIACGVVYNNARISLSERSRDLATLRVLGFRRAEISMILLGELGVLTFVAVPFGLGLGYALAALTSWSLDTELYRIPLVVDRATFGFAALVILVAAILSGLLVRRRLDHLDLVAVLKTRE